ncbi:carboxypeptidase-like regulatory domain-containing protein, partial [Bacteroidales bacterium OttesenSCG-928-A14]|nr:carboxypeptidase-like regulatory domain-containing protein [Bacteroidales bacterium OttesenSCG-928-A14]
MKQKYLLPLLLSFATFFHQSAFSQMHTLSGTVKSAADGETIFGAYMLLVNAANADDTRYTTTNSAGFYTFSSLPGTYILQINMMGFKVIN